MKLNLDHLINELQIGKGSVVSVIGSGGKTTLVEGLAEVLKGKYRVCIATSTKMGVPRSGTYSCMFFPGSPYLEEPVDQPGIYYAADEIVEGKKLHGFSSPMVNWALAHTDVILIEADGSKRLPLKGWAAYEPVVIPQTTLTIGVIPVWPVGQILDETLVHRFPLFTQITGARPGDRLTIAHMTRLIESDDGLFAKAKGQKVLFFSQVYDNAAAETARAIVKAGNFNHIKKIMIGCVDMPSRAVSIAVIIMASGFSSRMGTNKLLMDIEGRPMVSRVMDAVAQAAKSRREITRVIVVTAFEPVAEMARTHGFQVVSNPEPEAGQSRSVVLGTAAAQPADGLMYVPGDMPWLNPEVMNSLVDRFLRQPDRIIRPTYGGRPGAPVLFTRGLKDELLKITGDQGGRTVIYAHPDLMVSLPFEQARWGMDVDSPLDLKEGVSLCTEKFKDWENNE